jgi:exonuclease SbcC
MLKKAILKNYESHEDSTMEFSPGINVIIGDTDSGKSGSLRGILGVITNTMFGLEHISDWIRTKTGTVKAGKEGSVSIEADDKIITRFRSDKLNGYRMTGEQDLGAVRDKVPDCVANHLNVGDVNIQRQFNAPFLLGLGPTQVAKYLNSLVRLDVIDKYIQAVNKKVLANGASISKEEEEIKAIETQIESYKWIEDLEPIAILMKNLDEEIAMLHRKQARLNEMLGTYIPAMQSVEKAKVKVSASSLVERAKTLATKIEEKNRMRREIVSQLEQFMQAMESAQLRSTALNRVGGLYDRIKELDAELKTAKATAPRLKAQLEAHGIAALTVKRKDSISMAEKCVNTARSIATKISSKLEQSDKIKRSVILYNSSMEKIAKLKDALVKLEASRPKVCELCGRPFEQGEGHGHQGQ